MHALAKTEVDFATVRALDDANLAFSQAYVAGDAEAIVAAYAEDAVILTPEGGLYSTPEAINAFWTPISQRERALGHRLHATVRRPIAPGVILEVGDWRIGRRADGCEMWTTGQYTLVWRVSPQGWLIQYDSWTPPQKSGA